MRRRAGTKEKSKLKRVPNIRHKPNRQRVVETYRVPGGEKLTIEATCGTLSECFAEIRGLRPVQGVLLRQDRTTALVEEGKKK
jgi:hypothetical protein